MLDPVLFTLSMVSLWQYYCWKNFFFWLFFFIASNVFRLDRFRHQSTSRGCVSCESRSRPRWNWPYEHRWTVTCLRVPSTWLGHYSGIVFQMPWAVMQHSSEIIKLHSFRSSRPHASSKVISPTDSFQQDCTMERLRSVLFCFCFFPWGKRKKWVALVNFLFIYCDRLLAYPLLWFHTR